MIGPGKYDDLCSAARRAAEAQGVILIIAHGNKGHGFSVQATPEICNKVPQLLRDMADDIEKVDRESRIKSKGN